MDAIIQYPNNVFTNKGQSTVQGFGAKLNANAVSVLSKVAGLIVYTGYHGDDTGTFVAAFNPAELQDVKAMAKGFSNIKLMEVLEQMSDADIFAAATKGNVFFTWCDSDTKVNNVMKANGKSLGNGKALLPE